MKSRVESYQESFSYYSGARDTEPGENKLSSLNKYEVAGARDPESYSCYNVPKPDHLKSFMRTLSTPNKVFSKVKRDWTCTKCNQININLRTCCIKCNEKNEELFEME